MPATVFINENSSPDFRWGEFMDIFEYSRPYFEDSDLEEKVYDNIDIGLDAVFPKHLNQIEYNKMYIVLVQGLLFYKEQKAAVIPDSKTTINSWEYLLGELRKDERYSDSKIS